jgi:signal transduction histidine kinase
VLTDADPPPTWWRSPGQLRIGYIALGTATVLLYVASLFIPVSMRGQISVTSGGSSSGTFSRTACHMLMSPCPPPVGSSSSQVFYQVSIMPGTVWVVLALAVVVAPLAMAIRYPLLGWRIGWLGLLLVPLLDMRWWGDLPWDPVQILVLLVMLCAAGIRHGRPALYWLFALTLVPWWLWAIRDGLGVVAAALGTAAFGAMAVAAEGMASRRRALETLADQAEQTELERARRAVLEERARIARELHDVVAHHMSLMAIRAESAPHRLGALTDPVRAEFGALSGSAREAMADMRRLLGVLRNDQPSARAPQPGLPDLPGLVEGARRAGMRVELSPLPAPDQVPPSTGLCAYRIIQEALSNAGQHAAGAPVTVSVQQGATAVTLRVANGPHASSWPTANGHRPGHGLAGMRERAELLGGSLSAGPSANGGFVVAAVLPLSGSTT